MRGRRRRDQRAVPACSRSLPRCVPDGSDQPSDVVAIKAGDGVAEVDGDAPGETGRQFEDAPFTAEQGRSPALRAVIAASQPMAAIGWCRR